MDLPRTAAADSVTGYALEDPKHQAAAAVRVGFLANNIGTEDEPMLCYQDSPGFDERYTSLQGFYYVPGVVWEDPNNRFTIYEPNADAHPGGVAAGGSYVETKPIALINGEGVAVSIPDRLTVQKSSAWIKTSAETEIEERFQTALLGMNLSDAENLDLAGAFYGDYLQWQLSPYVEKGAFIQKTGELYQFNRTATAEQMASLDSAGATDDVHIIKLERNVPQRIRMFIWLEGQDVDCIDSVRSSSFAVNIELAGATE
jgi:hypothetical protein